MDGDPAPGEVLGPGHPGAQVRDSDPRSNLPRGLGVPPQAQRHKMRVCCAWRPQGRERPHLQLILGREISSKLIISTDVSSCSKSIHSLEHVQVELSLSYSRRGDLVVALSSPMGTTSTLVTVR